MTNPKFIFVVGGVMSSVGKGVSAASIGVILKARGYQVTAIKADPYINVDAGTMNPTEHGEVFVTSDGDETDQDIGNYERFLDQNIPSINYMTTGRVYQEVIRKERNLEYKGKCVEVVPHIPQEIIRRIKRAQIKSQAEVVIIEIGGTVGEYQNILFLEAARMMKLKHPEDVIFILVSYLPIPSAVGEMKTKPTQHAVRLMNEAGLQPDFIIARAEKKLDAVRRQKLALFCSIREDRLISAPDAPHIYAIPLLLEKEYLSDKLVEMLKLSVKKGRSGQNLITEFQLLNRHIETAQEKVRIGIVGKYFNTGEFVLADSYISVIEALKHACCHFKRKPELVWLDAENYERDPKNLRELKTFNGVLIPGGFGNRGVEGKILAIQYVRENKIPFFGLCYGMQLAAIEVARHLCRLNDAHTVEVNAQTPHPIVFVNPNQEKNIKEKHYGGTMRLGEYSCTLQLGTLSSQLYGKKVIFERHRHRYEFNNKYIPLLEKAGLIVAGRNDEQNLVEIMELKNHPWFAGTQFHPEFLSRPLTPHPLFLGFVKAAIKHHKIQ